MERISASRTRVVIVDDSRTIQAMLEQILTSRLNCEVVGIAGDGDAAIAMVRRLRPDLVTIDLAMPCIDGRQLLANIADLPDMHKVVISASECENLVMKASLESTGADGCICKRELSRDAEGFCRKLAAIMRTPKNSVAASGVPRAASRAVIVDYPVPADERERLVALAALGLTNDDPDHRLDLLTEHLVNITAFSACVMTFIDHDTQWVKSGCGLDRGSTVRSQAICNHTICGDEPFIVTDTSADSRFDKLDAVLTGAMIRSYAGHPIVGSSGVRLGALCLLDSKPRRITEKELTNLRSVARIAAELIESRSPPIDRAA